MNHTSALNYAIFSGLYEMCSFVMVYCNVNLVLGPARTGLVFARIQEGAQPGGLTPPDQTEQGIPYRVLSRWVPVGGEQGGGNSLSVAGGESGSLCSAVLFCVFSLSVSLSLLFPLFAVLLNCPYPDRPVSACFFLFSSAPRRGQGRPHGAFVAGRSQTITICFKKHLWKGALIHN